MTELPTAPDLEGDFQEELHFKNVRKAVESGQEGDWHDFKKGLFTDEEVKKLRKEVVALANTPGGPYRGYGYLIVGVENDGTLIGLVGRDADFSLDERVQQVKNLVQSGVEPYLDVQVRMYELSGKRLHVLIVPESPKHWALVTKPQDQQGPWLRRGWSSERPNLTDYAAYHERLVSHAVEPLVQQQRRLHLELEVLHQTVAELKSQVSPEQLTTPELIRTAFPSPERALQRALRRELAAYLSRMEGLHQVFNDLRVDQWLQHDETFTPDAKAQLTAYVEGIEAAVSPLARAVSLVIHETQQGQEIRDAVEEVTSTVADTSVYGHQLSPFQGALRTYPAQLFMQAVSLSTFHATRWDVFFDVLWHRHQFPMINGVVSHIVPGLILPYRAWLDRVIERIEVVQPLQRALYHRLWRLLPNDEWVGEHLPVLHRGGTLAEAEALLTFGYLASLAKNPGAQRYRIDVEWWTYLNANQILSHTLHALHRHWPQTLRRSALETIAADFDDMEKAGSHLGVSALAIAEELMAQP